MVSGGWTYGQWNVGQPRARALHCWFIYRSAGADTRSQQQKQRWFRRALRWRAGCEATISTLKHPFSMGRATYKGEFGFQRYVGWCVITKNLFSIARYQVRRRSHGQVG